MSVLQRLTQYFEGCTFEFCQLIEEEHAVVGETDFSGLRVVASAYQGDIGYSVVRRAERALDNERSQTVSLFASFAVGSQTACAV